MRNPYPDRLGLLHRVRMLAHRADQLAEELQLDRARAGAWGARPARAPS